MTDDIRWQQRLQNFDRALVLLREPIERGIETLSVLERAGTLWRFKCSVERAWKAVKSYLAIRQVALANVKSADRAGAATMSPATPLSAPIRLHTERRTLSADGRA